MSWKEKVYLCLQQKKIEVEMAAFKKFVALFLTSIGRFQRMKHGRQGKTLLILSN